jgi:VIT1/CCC1 family predicted Fe2+/Mn2+ transporter
MVIPLEEEEEEEEGEKEKEKGGIVKAIKHAGAKAIQASVSTYATTKNPKAALITGAVGAVSSFFD